MFSFIKWLEDGEYMTRIAIKPCKDKVVIASDTLFTEAITKKQTTNNQKLFYGDGMVVGILGLSELLTSTGKIKIGEYIQKYLSGINGVSYEIQINTIENIVKDICNQYKFNTPCLLVFIWVLEENYYMYYSQIQYLSSFTFGEGGTGAQIIRKLNPVNKNNLKKYCINNLFIRAGDGLFYNPDIRQSINEDEKVAIEDINTAILDKNITTVGGKIHIVELYTNNKTREILLNPSKS